jgi:EpsI family protein
MAILLAYFYKGSLWKKVLLVVSAVPLTIFTNSLRIAMTGILYEIWGPQVAEDFFHGFSGWFIFMFGLAVLLLEMWVLNGFRGLGMLGGFGGLKDKTTSLEDGLKSVPVESSQPPQALGFCSSAALEAPFNLTQLQASSSAGGASSAALLEPAEAAAKEGAPQGFQAASCPSDLKPETLNLKPAAGGWKLLLHPPQFIVAVAILATTLAAAQGIEFREKIPPAKTFASFPLEVGEWKGKREAMEKQFIDQLTFSDYVIVDYVSGSQAVNFYTAYYESQRKGESIHSPETCLPGGGWEFRNVGAVTLPLKARNGEPMRVNRALMERGAYKQLSYFWFPSRDRILTNAWEMKWYNFWDALTRQRTDGALVRLITPVYPNEEVAQAEARLTAFTQAIVPVLDEFLPK